MQREPFAKGTLSDPYYSLRGCEMVSASIVTLIVVLLDLLHGTFLRSTESLTLQGAVLPWILNFAIVSTAVFLLVFAESLALRIIFGLGQAIRRKRSVEWNVILMVLVASLPILYVLAEQPFVGNRYRTSPLALYGPWMVLPFLIVLFWLIAWGALIVLRALRSQNSTSLQWYSSAALVATLALGVLAVDVRWYVGWYPLIHSIFGIVVVVLLHALVLGMLARFEMVGTLGRLARTVVPATAVLAWVVSVYSWFPWNAWKIMADSNFGAKVAQPILQAWTPEGRGGFPDGLSRVDSGGFWSRSVTKELPSAVAEDVLLVTVDALRYDSVGILNKNSDLTPNIDKYFEEDFIFERAYSQHASTRYSLRAILQSRHPSLKNFDVSDNLISVLRDNGLDSVALLPTDLRLFTNLEQYNFSELDFYDDPEDILPKLKELISRVDSERTMVWVHFYQPHDPYDPRPEFIRGTGSKQMYDGEVRWVDHQFEELLSILPPSDSRLVVFGSDHGEEFYEHGGSLHGRTLYDETIRVPLFVKVPGLTGQRVPTMVANLDITPTIFSQLGISVPISYEGRDLIQEASSPTLNRVIYAESNSDVVGAIKGTRKWIYSEPLGLWEHYDLTQDPLEHRNLTALNPNSLELGQGYLSLYDFQADQNRYAEQMDEPFFLSWLQDYVARPEDSPISTRWVMFSLAKKFLASRPEGPDNNSEIQELLLQAYTIESNAFCRSKIVESFAGIDGPLSERARALFGEGAVADNVELRRACLAQLAKHRAGRDLILQAVTDPSPAIRRVAIESLSLFQDARELERLYLSSTDRLNRRAAMRSLLRVAESISPATLHVAMQDEDPRVRADALRAYSMRNDGHARTVLAKRWRDERSPHVRAALLEAMFTVNRDLGLNALKDEIRNPIISDYVRVRLIDEQGIFEEIDHLVTLFKQHEQSAFRRNILKTILNIHPRGPELRSTLIELQAHTFDPKLRKALNLALKS